MQQVDFISDTYSPTNATIYVEDFFKVCNRAISLEGIQTIFTQLLLKLIYSYKGKKYKCIEACKYRAQFNQRYT